MMWNDNIIAKNLVFRIIIRLIKVLTTSMVSTVAVGLLRQEMRDDNL